MKISVFATVLAAICSCQYVLGQIGVSMGPLNINLVRSSSCEGDQGIVNIDVVDINGNQKGLTVDVNTPYDLDDTVSYEVVIHQFQNGELRKNVFKHGGDNACVDFDKFLGNLWKKIVEAGGWDAGCPKKAGHFTAENFPFDDKDVDVKAFFYGRFIMVINMKKEGELVVCQEVEFTNSRPGASVK